MATLSERLKQAADEYESMGRDLGCFNGPLVTAVRNAETLALAVEAFQAAEQERKAAWADKSKPEWDAKRAALSSINVAKSRARLLEVKLE
jgi:hypothetical protein